jgi:heptosyltransferase-2
LRRILILKPCCLGDVLMATPMLSALAEAFPEAAIDWAVGVHSRPAIEGHPQVRSLLDASHCIRGELRLADLLHLIHRIRKGSYDVLVAPDRSPLLSLVALFSGVPVRAGLASGWRGFGYTHRVEPKPDDHEAMLYLRLVEALAEHAPTDQSSTQAPPRITFYPSATDRQQADARIREHKSSNRNVHDGLLVAIHPAGGVNPGMTLLSKRWPAERFAALAERLINEKQATILLLGGPDDRAVADAVLAAISRDPRRQVVDLCGQLSLGATAAAIQSTALFIGNDTGVSHLASGACTPSLMIFGPTSPVRYGPLPGSGMAIAPPQSISRQDRDAPLQAAQDSVAIEQVTVDQAWAAALRLMKSEA